LLGACVNAEAATLFAAFDEPGFRRIALALDATLAEVTSDFFAMEYLRIVVSKVAY
jgi:hypothetical protein